jgi:hypothetical protein
MKSFSTFLIEQTCEETIKFNKDNEFPLYENPFRPDSEMFLEFFNYIRNLNPNNLDEDTIHILETDIGKQSIIDNNYANLDLPYINNSITEDTELNIPHRGGAKKFYVYVKNELGNIVKVSFGYPGMDVKINDPIARKSFASRHNCKDKTDRTTPGYWSCNLPRYAKYLGLEGGGNYYW